MVFHVYRKNDRKWDILFGNSYDELLNLLSVRYQLSAAQLSKIDIEKDFDIIPLSTNRDYSFL